MSITPGQCRTCNQPTPNRDDWYCAKCRRPIAAKAKPERDSGWSGPTATDIERTVRTAHRLGVPIYRTPLDGTPVRITKEAA